MNSMTNGFDIVIVTWNNQQFLQTLLSSIEKNSAYPHHVLIHVNEGTDGTREYLDSIRLRYSETEKNVGQSVGTNIATLYGSKDYLYFVDDDMYLLPGWDRELVQFARSYNFCERMWLSSAMIEPRAAPHSIAPHNYGSHPLNFAEEKLLREYRMLDKDRKPFINTHWPLLTTRNFWKKIGGCDLQFPWGIGIEIDMLTKAWFGGCRNPVCVPSSRVYHFQSQSTRRLVDYESIAETRDKIILERIGMPRQQWLTDVLHKNQEWSYQENV